MAKRVGDCIVFPKRLKNHIKAGIRAMEEIERRGYHFLDDARHALSIMKRILNYEGTFAPRSEWDWPNEFY